MPDNPAGTAEDPIQISHLDFPVVGIGASAGGLVAVSALLANLPADNGMAFVVILHLSPKHESSADQLLQRSTRIPVVQVSYPQQIERNHVYVISPSVDLLMNDGSLIVQSAARPRGRIPPSIPSSAPCRRRIAIARSAWCCRAPDPTGRSASPH
jgi:two-component system CheB/CheR fusion protein